MAEFKLNGKSFKTNGRIPAWANMQMVKASQKKDGAAMLSAFTDFLELIILPEEAEAWGEELNSFDINDDKFMESLGESLNVYISEVTGNPKV